MHVQNNMAESHSQKSTRSKRIFRRKWGVRVAENVIHPNQSSELVKKNVPHSQRKHTEQTSTWKTPHEENLLEPASIESPNASKLRMSLLGNRSNDDSYVKRPERTNEVFKITDDVTQYSSDPEGSTVFDDEYYVPLEMTDEEIMDAWQEIVRKSRMPVDHVNPQLPAELQEIDSMFIRPEPPKPKLDIQTVRPISNPKSSTRYFSTCNCAMYSDPSNHTYPDSSSTNDLTHLNVIENNENSDSLYDCPLKLPIRPLTPIKYTYDYLQEDEDFMNSLSTVPYMILDFPIDEKLTENNPNEEKDNTVISFSKSPEGNVVTTAKESTKTATLDSTNIIPEKSLNIKPDGKDQSEAKFTVDGDFVRVDGDPYPYSREHFEKWRMPQKGSKKSNQKLNTPEVLLPRLDQSPNETVNFANPEATNLKEISNLVEKPPIVTGSNTSDPEASTLQRFKLQRIQSINTAETKRIYELKNYDYLKLSGITESKTYVPPKIAEEEGEALEEENKNKSKSEK